MKKTKVVNIDTSINSLINAGQKFDLIETTLTCQLICKYGTFSWSQNSNLKLHELGFINQVFKSCEKLPKPPKIERKEIKYIDINRTFKSSENCYEIDLNSAYWEEAYKSGYLSEKVYLKGKEKHISKFARLVALGNLAKVKYLLHYNGNEYEFQGTEESEMKDIFFNSCLKCSEIMKDLKNLVLENYLFYWVDAIFVNSEMAKNLIVEYLECRKIPHKIKFIPKIENLEKSIVAYQQDITKKPKHYMKISENSRTPINKLLNLAKEKKQLENESRNIDCINVDTLKIYKHRTAEEIVF
jgi:hypothetical protein